MPEETYTPKLGITGNTPFSRQFNARIDIRSLACSPVEYFDLSNGLMSQHASGFFYRHGRRVFFVSARHAISGTNPFTDEAISKATGFLPREIQVYPYFNGEKGQRMPPVKIKVRDEDETPLWLEDPDFASLRTDIACVDLGLGDDIAVACVNDAQDENLLSNVGMDCFVVGYPSSQYYDPMLPIWRKASIAYEPLFPVDSKPIFLVDAMTSKGMSGSPIFQRWHGEAPLHTSQGLTVKSQNIVSSRFIGVYGGRLSNTEALAEIGYGWYENRIPHILSNIG